MSSSPKGFPGGSDGKESTCSVAELSLFPSSLEKGMATHFSILAWRIPWTEESGELWSMESQGIGHDWKVVFFLGSEKLSDPRRKPEAEMSPWVRQWTHIGFFSKSVPFPLYSLIQAVVENPHMSQMLFWMLYKTGYAKISKIEGMLPSLEEFTEE